jgi:hypothetical protein
MTLPSPDNLRTLLRHLSLESVYRLPLSSLQSVEDDDDGRPSAVWLNQTLDAHRRLVYKGRDFSQSGLFEFEVGLGLMEDGRQTAAIVQFAMARRQWRFADDAALLALADLALGLARQYSYEYDGALESYYRVEDDLAEVERTAASSQISPERDTVRFVQEATQVLRSALSALNDSVRSASEARPHYVATVEPPIIDADLGGDGRSKEMDAVLQLCFEIKPPATVRELSNTVLPTLEAIEHIDRVLVMFLASDRGSRIRVKQSASESPIVFGLEGVLPQTAELCASVQADSTFNESLAELLTDLATAKAQQAATQTSSFEQLARPAGSGWQRGTDMAELPTKVAAQGLCLQKALALLDNYAPTTTAHHERLGLAAQLAPALQVLAGALADRQLTIETTVPD